MQPKDHLIIEKAWKYTIIGFNFQQDLSFECEPFIDLTLQSDEEIRRLRFLSPQNIELKHNFTSCGLCILDIADKGLEVKVEVDNFEDASIKFLAREVVDLDKATDEELEILQIEFIYKLRNN